MCVLARTVCALTAACALAAPRPALAQGHFPWAAGATPPTVASVALGQSRTQIEAALGAPDSLSETSQSALLVYRSRGLEFVILKVDPQGAIYIALVSRDAGALDSMRVGDSASDARRRWGEPNRVDAARHVLLYDAGSWTLSLKLDESDTRIVRMGISQVITFGGE